ncbi:ubiquitin carboxyl-terminal hydrolase 31 isoform X1 [Brienomyrus brachyistius]|uniref:ubiquitin carboxyl-terminal hydrolase 31 isoform X1 n=1 Tax=Brienomyrus brachyistius TaxID=42636 RepID=UPI0020B3C35B|nr:ubiquitin carboxyl-terminal hydrolase 31 isoform X1 [Brienomyrus brachyistius]
MMSKAATKEKKSFGKKLFRRGSVRSVGNFMSRVLKTLSTLSHFGTEEHVVENEKDDGGFTVFKSGGKGAVTPGEGDRDGIGGDRVPGLSGLKNHGNTCFMNAVLQCLSNTELFAEYLALEQFRGGGVGAQDELEDKDDKGIIHGQKKDALDSGEVTEQLSGLVRALWTFEYTPQHSREFKNVVSKNALQYRGNAQHDAQEFLLWLLDRVHEDLNHLVHPSNRSSIKPPLVEDDRSLEGPTLPLSAGSFVQELFQAQYRSSLTCPHCQKQSNTFDPFLCISLPIPLPHTRPLYVTVVYQGKTSHCMRIGVAVPLHSTVFHLREAISVETKVPSDQIVLCEMYYDGFHRSFCNDAEDLNIIQESDSIFAFETPETFRPENAWAQRGSLQTNLNQNNLKYSAENNRTASFMQGAVSPNKNSEKIVLLVCNRTCTGHQGRRFGHPFVLHLERTVSWEGFQKEILEKMKHLLRPGVGAKVGLFSLRVVGVVGITYLLPQEEQPLSHPTVERAYKACGLGGPAHVKVVVEWDKDTRDYLFGSSEEEYIPDADSVRLHRELHSQPQACTLAHCFQLYTKEEQLAPDDAWRCPHCKQLQQGRIKLSLWTLPDVLILHLKRFRQEADRRVKIQNVVRFPLVGMDMAPHMVKRSQSSWSLPSHWSPWRRPYGLGRDPHDYLYDLYAVCNHHGSMHGGHYTAYCKNSVDGQWYCFDDSDVQPIPEEQVCKQTAYILFYQRRTAIPSWSANSSVAGSTSSSLCEHWVNRLPGSRQASVASGASSRRTSLASLAESGDFPGERSEDDGGFSIRPFVRSVQRQSLSSRSSLASPLTLNENGIKPSWSLSAKLHLRSNSPSRFSLDSFSSSLERIGETCDDKVSTSCFGSYSRHERQANKAPLAKMEGITSDEGNGTDFVDETYCRAPIQPDKKSFKADQVDNSNQLPGVEQKKSGQGNPSKEQKRRSTSGGSGSKSESSGTKRSSAKIASDMEKTSKKRLGGISTSKSSSSPVSSSPRSKSYTKVSNLKDKTDSAKITRSPSTGTPSKKVSAKGQETPPPGATQQKQRISSMAKSSVSASPPVRKTLSGTERTLATGRGKLEKSVSQDSPRTSPLVDKPKPSPAARASLPRGVDGSRLDKRLRSSSSSSSVTSLRSPSASSRELHRNNKSEEKGLSFFKSSLRQKETRRSADLGKTAMLAKKASEGATKGGTLANGSLGTNDGSSKPPLKAPPAFKGSDKERSPKTSTPVKRLALSQSKSKSSTPEMGQQSPANGNKLLEKTASSRKLSSGMQSSARLTQKPQ